MSASVQIDAGTEVSIVETLGALEDLREEWAHLHRASAVTTPFQSPEWLLAWTRAFVHGPLRVLAVRSRGELVALVPLFRHDAWGERRLRLLGAGISDYLDGVFAPSGTGSDVIGPAFRSLVTTFCDWDVCQLEQLGENAVLRTAPLLAASSAHVRLAVETHVGTPGAVTCPRIHLRDARSLEEVVTAQKVAKLRKYRRRAERDARLALDVVTAPAEVEAAFATFLTLHDARWHGSDTSTAFADPAVRGFHAAVVGELARTGALRLYVLRLGGRPIASLYGLAKNGTLYCYAQGFDPTAAELSPGLLLLGAVLDDAIAKRMRCVDLLRGREPYKYAWSAVDLVTVERRVRPVR